MGCLDAMQVVQTLVVKEERIFNIPWNRVTKRSAFVSVYFACFSDMFISFSPVETPPPPAEPKWSDSPSAVNHLTQVPVLIVENFMVVLGVKRRVV